jgi:hypothetical protein
MRGVSGLQEHGRGGKAEKAKAANLEAVADLVRFQLHTTHIDQVTTQLGLVPRQCSLTFRIL